MECGLTFRVCVRAGVYRIKLGCKSATFDQYSRLLLATLLPLGVFVALAVAFLIISAVMSGDSRTTWRRRMLSAGLVLAFFMYPGVSAEIVKSFRCLTFDDGSSVLRADVSIDCNSARYDR